MPVILVFFVFFFLGSFFFAENLFISGFAKKKERNKRNNERKHSGTSGTSGFSTHAHGTHGISTPIGKKKETRTVKSIEELLLDEVDEMNVSSPFMQNPLDPSDSAGILKSTSVLLKEGLKEGLRDPNLTRALANSAFIQGYNLLSGMFSGMSGMCCSGMDPNYAEKLLNEQDNPFFVVSTSEQVNKIILAPFFVPCVFWSFLQVNKKNA